MFEICSKLTIKTPERHQWRCLGVFIVNFEQISHIALFFPLPNLNKKMPVGGLYELFATSYHICQIVFVF